MGRIHEPPPSILLGLYFHSVHRHDVMVIYPIDLDILDCTFYSSIRYINVSRLPEAAATWSEVFPSSFFAEGSHL